jgi:hypothetical protein
VSCQRAINAAPDIFPKFGPTVAKPSGDHIPLGGFVRSFSIKLEQRAPILDDHNLPCSAWHRDDGLGLAHRLARKTSDLVGFGQPRQQQIAHQDNTRRPKYCQPEDYGANRAHVRCPRHGRFVKSADFRVPTKGKTLCSATSRRRFAEESILYFVSGAIDSTGVRNWNKSDFRRPVFDFIWRWL